MVLYVEKDNCFLLMVISTGLIDYRTKVHESMRISIAEDKIELKVVQLLLEFKPFAVLRAHVFT